MRSIQYSLVLKREVSSNIMLIARSVLSTGCVHRSRNVCPEGEKGSRDARRLWDGSGQGNEEGDREEHVLAQALEVVFKIAEHALCKATDTEGKIYCRLYMFFLICKVCIPSDSADTRTLCIFIVFRECTFFRPLIAWKFGWMRHVSPSL